MIFFDLYCCGELYISLELVTTEYYNAFSRLCLEWEFEEIGLPFLANTTFGRKSNNRFELAIAFLKEADQSEKYAQQENPERIRDFLKKIGSNFRIAGRTLFLDFKNAFKIAKKHHAEVLCAEAVSYDFTKSENWRASSV
ncbi:MAG: hypothetical protein ACSLEX_01580 [Minisyncoccota bacterium]